MTPKARFAAAIRGEPVDRVPCVAWTSFASDALPGEEVARRHLAWVGTFGWDVCKVMHDYRIPLPDGLATIARPEDMRRFTGGPATTPNYTAQLAALHGCRDALGPDVPVLDTLFDPFQQVMRRIGFSGASLLCEHPREAVPMLEALCETTLDYVSRLKALGIDGVLYATNGAIRHPGDRGVPEDAYRTLIRPFDLRILEALDGMVRIVHAHGAPIELERMLDYPCEAWSVSDRLAGNPSLADLRRLTGRCLMGGIHEGRLHDRSVPELDAEIADAIGQAGRRGFILAPGCNAAPQTPAHLLRLIPDAAARHARD